MMPIQMDLFPPSRGIRARKSDPETSKVAAEQAESVAQKHFRMIMAALQEGRGTIYDIAERSMMTHVQVARRMPELQAMGKVVPGGSVAGPTGRPCRLWWAK